MDQVNYLTQISNNIDYLGRTFTTVTYGALATYLSPVLTGLFTIYLIFWGIQFWLGRGDSSISEIVLKLLRVAVIFSFATSWGPIQNMVYGIANQAPNFVGSVLLSNIVNPDKGGMSSRTVERDMFDFLQVGVQAAGKINERDTSVASPVADKPVGTERRSAPNTVSASRKRVNEPINSAIYSAIVLISCSIFIGFAFFVIIFAKLSLWITLALSPLFIAALMFRVPSRLFLGWLSVLLQSIITPTLLYSFLAFFFLGAKGLVIEFIRAINNPEKGLSLQDISPFLLLCFAGLFLVAQSVPLAGKLSAMMQSIATTGFGYATGPTFRVLRRSNVIPSNTRTSTPTTDIGAHGSREPGLTLSGSDAQARLSAAHRQARNR